VGEAVATRELMMRLKTEPGLLNPVTSSALGHTYESLFKARLGPPSRDEL